MMVVRRASLVLAVAATALTAPISPDVPLSLVEPAEAQARTEGRSFLQMLFGRRARQRAPEPQAPVRRSRQRSAPAVAAPPPAEVQPKEETALRILVVGDFVAGAVARGLDQTFAEETRVAIMNRANGNSGLVRDDYYDWRGLLPDILNEEQPDVVVVAIGSNDRQQIKQDGKRYAPLSSDWEQAYAGRIREIAQTLEVYGRPFFWVGTAPMRSASFSRDMAYFNGLYKPAVVELGGYFIDIWNGFANEDGRFVSSGPDVDGNLRALRTKDGINFTRAGRLKLAFYVDREMKRQIGFGTGASDVLLLSSPTSQIEIGPDGEKRLVGPIISLSGPRPGARDELAGEPEAMALSVAEGEEPSPQQLLIIEGQSPEIVGGRVDDHSWPPNSREPLPATPVSTN